MIKSLMKNFFGEQTICYKIIDIIKDKTGAILIKYQLSGKSIFYDASPLDLLKELGEIKGFSPKDSKNILDLVFNQDSFATKRIIELKFYQNKMARFIIQDNYFGNSVELSAKEILECPSIVYDLSKKDMEMVFFQHAQEGNMPKINRNNKLISFKKHKGILNIHDH